MTAPDPATTVTGERSTIDPVTLRAYRETAYRVHGERPVTLEIDVRSPALSRLHARHEVESSAFVTACNPLGRRLDEAANDARRTRLAAELMAAGIRFVDGIGEHPDGRWSGEPSVLAFGLSLERACALGRAHEQNALLWSDRDATPRLVLLR